MVTVFVPHQQPQRTARPSSSSRLTGPRKSGYLPPAAGEAAGQNGSRGKAGAVLRGQQVKDREPQRRGRELRPFPRPCADRDRPWARSLGACGMRGGAGEGGDGGYGEQHHGAPAPRQRPASGFVKAFFVGGRERFAINTTARELLLRAYCADRSRGMRLAVAARAYERGRRG